MAGMRRRAACFCGCAVLSSCAPPPCDNPTEQTLGALTPWEQAYLDAPAPASPPPSFLAAEDGLGLAVHDWVPTDWDGAGSVVLFVPGSSAYAELYAQLGEGLATRGVLSRIIDVRGHGRSVCSASGECNDPPAGGYRTQDDGDYWVGRPGDSLDEDQITRDVSRHVAALRALYPDARLTLSGHSSGGGVVSRYVEHGGLATVDGVALIAPFNHPDQAQNLEGAQSLCPDTAGSSYAQVDLAALGDALRGNEHRYVLNFVKEPALTTDLDTLRYTYPTVAGMAADDPDGFLAAYVQPVLWLAAEHDAVLDLAASRAQFDRLAGGGAFVTVLGTSHVGLSWSDPVAGVLATWAVDPTAVVTSELSP